MMIFKKRKADITTDMLDTLIKEVKLLKSMFETELNEFKSTKVYSLNQTIQDLQEQLTLEQAKVLESEERMEILHKKYLSACSSIGGLKKHNIKLAKDYDNLKQKFKNCKSNYTKTTLPPEEVPKSCEMGMKRSRAKSGAKILLKQKNERDYEREY